MRKSFRPVNALLALIALIIVGGALYASTADGTGYVINKTLQVGGDGGFDYTTLDADGKLLYLTRMTHTQIVDAASGKVVGDVPDNSTSHGVALVPELNRGFISNGKDATVQIFDLKTYESLGKIKAAVDADCIIYDSASKHVLAICGDAHQVIAIAPDVDPKTGKADAIIELGAKPEFAVSDGAGKVYIALVDDNQIAVVDTKAMKLITKWPVAPAARPVGMSMDRATRRLYVGCRSQHMAIMSADDGHVLQTVPIGAGVDASAFRDGTSFASCTDGTLTMIRETSPGKFEATQTLKTLPRAKTMAVDAKTGTIYLPTVEPGGTPQKPGNFVVLVLRQPAAK